MKSWISRSRRDLGIVGVVAGLIVLAFLRIRRCSRSEHAVAFRAAQATMHGTRDPPELPVLGATS